MWHVTLVTILLALLAGPVGAQPKPDAAPAAPSGSPDAAARYVADLAKAKRDFWSATLQAKQAYAAQLSSDIKRAMQAGDLDEANRINAARRKIQGEIAAIQAGEPMTVEAPLPRVVAFSGFNIKEGMGLRGGTSPYKLNEPVPGHDAQDVEFGWAGGWNGNVDKFTVVPMRFEGDACGKFDVPSGYLFVFRELKTPLRGKIQIEQSMMTDDRLDVLSRPGGPGAGTSNWGPNWRVQDGEFIVLDGRGDESKDDNLWKKTGIKIKPHVWYTVTLTIDITRHNWEFAVNGQKFQTTKPLGFRSSPDTITAIDYLPASTFYIDAIKVTQLELPPEKGE